MNGGIIMSQHEIFDITIIGGGPAGLYAAFYAGMRQAKTKVIESLPELGGQLNLLYPDKEIYDIPGYPTIKAKDLIANLTKQMAPFDHTICLNEEVTELHPQADGTLKLISEKGEHYTKSVIITAGNGAFQPRKLQLDYPTSLEEKSIHYFIPNVETFKGKDIVLCGGGDSAVDWALMLEPIAKSVTLVHRRPAFRAHEHSLKQLKKSSVIIKTPYVISNCATQDNLSIDSVTITNPRTAEEETLLSDHLIVSYGFVSHLGEMNEWNLELARQSIKVNSDMSTNIPGVYAAGDICSYDGKVKLIATGFGEAPTAVNNALHFIEPTIRTQPAHSTSVFADGKLTR